MAAVVSPGYQQQWYWVSVCRINRSLSSTTKHFKYRCLLGIDEYYVSTMASQITGTLTVCLAACLSWQQTNHQSSASVTGGFPSQRANNSESISMSWHQHVDPQCLWKIFPYDVIMWTPWPPGQSSWQVISPIIWLRLWYMNHEAGMWQLLEIVYSLDPQVIWHLGCM